MAARAPGFLALLWALLLRWARRTLCAACGRNTRTDAAFHAAESAASLDRSSLAAYSALVPVPVMPDNSAWAGGAPDVAAAADAAAIALVAPHVESFDTVLTIVLDDNFPYPLMGSVHTSSFIDADMPALLARLLPTSMSASSVSTGGLPSRATWASDTAHRRGTETLVRVSVGGGAWASDTRMLFFHGLGVRRVKEAAAGAADAGAEADKRSAGADVLTSGALVPSASLAQLPLPADLPHAWAALSGDRNPIHMHWLGAWAFGFRSGRRAVAHGMSVVLAALPSVLRALLQRALADMAADAAVGAASRSALALLRASGTRLQLRVSFVRPTFVPSQVVVLGDAVAPGDADGGAKVAEGSETALRRRGAASGGGTRSWRLRFAVAPAARPGDAGSPPKPSIDGEVRLLVL